METRYIDDQFGDLVTGTLPTYNPVNGWTQGADCTGCGFHPDAQRAFNQSWYDTTHHTTDETRSVQFGFTGTSLDVFCIIPNPSNPGLTSTYNLTFELDGQPLEQTFTHESDSSNVFLFNTSVLSLENLTLAPHMFVMLAASTVVNSTLLFDYAMYTIPSTSLSTPDLSPTIISSASPSPIAMPHPAVAAIIGSAVGGTIFLILIIALVLWYRHYKRRPRMLKQYVSSSRSWDYGQDETRIEPFPLQPLRRLPLESHSTNNLNPQRSETSVTYPSTIITGVTGSSYHMTSEGYSSPPALDANFALPATTVRFAENTTTSETSSNSRSRNRRVDTATPSSRAGRSSRRANNGSTATSSSAPSSTHSSRKREIRELRRTVEDLKRQQQEMLARLPPSYTDISNQGLG